MLFFKGAKQLVRPLERPVVTIGNFDGVHLGHREIIGQAVSQAKARGGQSVVYTFRPHPQAALNPSAQIELLTSYDEKLERLGSLGVDVLIEEPFEKEFYGKSATEFFEEVVIGRIGAEAVVIGYDFGFGRGRQGHLEALTELCKKSGIGLTVVPQQKLNETPISSSRIRERIKAGDIETANKLLGREFGYSGKVTHGDSRGKGLGFPTANLELDASEGSAIKIRLPLGVYAVRALVDGRAYSAVANIGVRPTFDAVSREPVIEVHLIGETLDLYSKRLDVRFVSRLREERRFPSVDELRKQISQDIQAAVKILS